jgi:hypothetical protein
MEISDTTSQRRLNRVRRGSHRRLYGSSVEALLVGDGLKRHAAGFSPPESDKADFVPMNFSKGVFPKCVPVHPGV